MSNPPERTDLLIEAREGATAVLTLNYPERRNALAIPLRSCFAETFERLEADREVRAIVITGGDSVFSSGGDISGMDATDLWTARDRFRLTHRVIRQMLTSAKPMIAAVEGWAAGAGLSLALCCDTVIAAEDARFVSSFGRVGLIADLGLPFTLPARVGMGRARQILLYGEPIAAPKAERIGLIDQVVPKGQALPRALERARFFASAAPLPVALTKRLLSEGLDAALEKERDLQSALFLTADHAEGRDAFLAKRQPDFKGV
jgi:2-(1,2-epoxy-1,2-dihydrophenyl)acetyl-CoA isomerase